MGDKRSVEDDKMSDAYVRNAREMGRYLLKKEYRGLGDTIEAAAHRVEIKMGVPATLLLRIRHRPIKDMMLSSYVAIATAYERAVSRAEAAYEHERTLHAANSKTGRLADFVAGQTIQEK